MDSYLELAAIVLKKIRRPLDARQILTSAYQLSIVPSGLYGKTQHKTLHARLAEDIRRQRARSPFVRTDPGRFFLRSLLADPTVPQVHKREYPARPRADQLRNFDVLCLRRADAKSIDSAGLFDHSLLASAPLLTRRLSDIYGDETYLFIRTFVITQRCDSIIARRSFFRLTDTMASKWSLGAIGFVKDHDKTMFSEDSSGLTEASLRTLSEQLDLNHAEAEFIHSERLINLVGLTISPADAGENSMIAVSVCRCPERFDPIGRYNDPRAFYWMPTQSRINDMASLDPWSRAILESGILDIATSEDRNHLQALL